MLPKSFFTTQELLELMKNSPTIQEMRPFEVYACLLFAREPRSDGALRLYRVLKEEKVLMQRVENNFAKTMNQLMEELQNGLGAIKFSAKRKNFPSREQENQDEEDEITQKLLSTLANKK